jgi:hypothetical protein
MPTLTFVFSLALVGSRSGSARWSAGRRPGRGAQFVPPRRHNNSLPRYVGVEDKALATALAAEDQPRA